MVMLGKILILLAGQPNETSGYLAHEKSEKKKKRVGACVCVWCGEGGVSIIEVPGRYQFIQGQYGRFQFMPVSRQRFHLVWLVLSLPFFFCLLAGSPCHSS